MVSVITTNTVIQTIPGGNKPVGIAINSTGTNVYVTNSADNTVSIIDPTTSTVTATVQVGVQPLASRSASKR